MYLCQTQNISQKGVFIATTMKLPVDSLVSFEFPLPTTAPSSGVTAWWSGTP